MIETMTASERLRELEAQRDQIYDERGRHIKAANMLFAESDQLSKQINSLRAAMHNANRFKRKETDAEEMTT